MFLQSGVRLEEEERQVRRVLRQRDMRVTARLEGPGFVALGASTRDDRRSAVRVITLRGVVVAEDGAEDDLFAPSRVVLLEHFGGTLGDYVFVATARIPYVRDVGCVSLHRLLPDATAVEVVLDVSALGSRACVSNLAPGGGSKLRARVAWPGLYALRTPQLDVELAFNEPLVGQPVPLIPVAHIVDAPEWLDEERRRLSVVRLSRAPFSDRHQTGIARAALARLAGQSIDVQVAAYRNAIHRVLPNSTEAEVVGDTVAHMERGWDDPRPPEAREPADDPREDGRPEGEDAPTPVADDAVVIEPDEVEPLP